jgi:HEAT repeat protein
MRDGANDARGFPVVEERVRGRAFRDFSEEGIQSLVDSLNSLHEGELGIDMLVACGEKAVEPLRRFLFEGRPSGIFVPRQRAVRALAELGAKQVLLTYLTSEKHIEDPVAAHGEEAVRNTAARALGAWRTDDVYEALRVVLRKRCLPGAIEVLGEFRRPEAVPELIAALEDDFCRTTAEEALSKIGELAHAALVEAARTPDPSGVNERPSSRRRRRCALRLLEQLHLSADDWQQIAALVHDRDPEIRARAAAIALAVADQQDQKLAVRRLIEALPESDWLLQGEIQGWLEAHLDIALAAINEEISQRQTTAASDQSKDNVLRLLLAVTVRHRNPARDERQRR